MIWPFKKRKRLDSLDFNALYLRAFQAANEAVLREAFPSLQGDFSPREQAISSESEQVSAQHQQRESNRAHRAMTGSHKRAKVSL